jgi:glycosyltransferase involved in cell wall biosynthesis
LICTNPDYLERIRDRWNCALVPNGVDPSRFAPGRGDRSQFGIATDRPVVLMVSALEENKRVLDGMRAVAALDDVAMVVAGDGPLRTEVDRLAAEILPDRFLRLTVDKSQMPELYRCADVFLHTTKAESFGNVYIEALASGLPVVAHDATTTRWILGDQARLVDIEQPEQIVDALRGALADGRGGAAEQAGRALTRFSWSTIAAQYRSHFESAIAAHRRG